MKMTVTRKRARTIIYPLWVAGSSAGAVTAALIAGNRKTDRIERLREFWNFPLQRRSGQPFAASVRLWMGAIRTRLTGSAGHFHPRIPSVNPYGFRSLYDLAPMQARMARLIDFGNLNSGETRIHIETGEPVIFASSKMRIEMDHLLASCGFLREFAPVEIGGRLFGDGGRLSTQAWKARPIAISYCTWSTSIPSMAVVQSRWRPLQNARTTCCFGNQTVLRLRPAIQLQRGSLQETCLSRS
jgi:NTE family protein